jgi:hypothetical protein
LINITPGLPALTFVLTDGFNTVTWIPVGKDGAELPVAARASREARQLVAAAIRLFVLSVKPFGPRRGGDEQA